MRKTFTSLLRARALMAIVVTSWFLTACHGGNDLQINNAQAHALAQSLGSSLKLSVAIDANNAAANGVPCASLGADWASCARGRLILENRGAQDLSAGGSGPEHQIFCRFKTCAR